MIALWLLVGSLVGGDQALRLAAGFPGESVESVWQFAIQSEASAKLLQSQDPKRATVHFHAAVTAYRHVWVKLDHSPEVAARLAGLYRQRNARPEAILWCLRGLKSDPVHRACTWLLDELRAEATGDSLMVSDRTLFPSHWDLSRAGGRAYLGFFLGCLLLARGMMTRNRAYLALGWILIITTGSFSLLLSIDAAQREQIYAQPQVVIRSDDAVIRSGNGQLYPPRQSQTLLPGSEAVLLFDRGGWLHIRLPSGLTGWVEAEKCLKVGDLN